MVLVIYDELCSLLFFFSFSAAQLENFSASFQILPKQGFANRSIEAASG